MAFMGSISDIGGAVGRRLRSWRAAEVQPAPDLDPYEPTPLRREELAALFGLRSGAPLDAGGDYARNERAEHDRMSLIRGALYPRD